MTDTEGPRSAVLYDWTNVASDHPVDHISRQIVKAERTMVGRMVVEPGFQAPPHVHHNEQISIVVEGSVVFRVAEVGSDDFREVVVQAGQVLVLPPHVPHGIRADEHALVFDLFSPPSDKTGLDQG